MDGMSVMRERTIQRGYAQVVIDLLGGPQAAAKAAGVGRTQVWRWTASKNSGGTEGIIPQERHEPIMRYCRDKGIYLPPKFLLPRIDD